MSSPDWTELCLEIAVEDTDRAAAIANMAVPYGIYIEDYSDLGADPFIHQPGGQSGGSRGLPAGTVDSGGHPP